MAFVFIREDNVYIVYGDSIILSESSKEPIVLKNPAVKVLPSSNDSSEPNTKNKPNSEEAGAVEDTEDDAKKNSEKADVFEDTEGKAVSPGNFPSVKFEAEDKKSAEEAENSDHPEESSEKCTDSAGVICCCLTPCGQYLALADHAKRLIVWNNKFNTNWEVLSCRTTRRKCITLSFCQSTHVILAADRAGDVYSFSISNPMKSGELQLGHLSMLLDMVITDDGKFIITSDRDEKIRVSHFPNTYNIESYCLGHSEFVSALSLYISNMDWLLSGSGDGTLRLWDYKAGKQLCSHSYVSDIQPIFKQSTDSAQAQKVPAVSLIEVAAKCNVLAVLFDKLPCISIYQLNSETGPSLEHIQLVVTLCEPLDIKLSASNKDLYVLAPTEEEDILTVYQAPLNESKITFKPLSSAEYSSPQNKLRQLLREQCDSIKACKKRDDFKHLYKQWFDNMKTYLEKKELRQKEKNKCKKKKKKYMC